MGFIRTELFLLDQRYLPQVLRVRTSYLAGLHRLFLEAKLSEKDYQTALQEANARAYEMETICLDPLAHHLHQLFVTDEDVQRVRMASEALPFVISLPDCPRVQAAFCAASSTLNELIGLSPCLLSSTAWR